ncbi:Transducin/WD40 repeat-like superfamily protein [Striga hermonthica]|uniref:Transducin/WD40 repeat-like superfamily protein n=1 Tax=Striga hermonthica TaxID=68872 RepID=A0A9N7NNH4_STRHE|nr:Transducin/WD40 repeat-like superfamily protein [Striga hermonthica]
MGKFFHFQSPLNSQSSDHSEPNQYSESSSDTSIASQPSLPSVPSLQQPTAAAIHHCSSTLKTQSSQIFSLTHAGKHLYCGGADGSITVCDRSLQNPDLTAAAKSSSAVKSISICGDRVFAAHQDHKIRVWKMDARQPELNKIAVLPTLGDRCARFFSPKNYVKIRRHKRSTWIHHVDAVSALALNGNSSLLYSASWDRSFKVWRTSDFKCLESVQNAHDDAINAVVLSSDGVLYTGSADRKIKVWKRREGEGKHSLVSTLEKHRSGVNALALNGDGSVLYSGACDRSIVVWEKSGHGHMAVAGALRGHTKAILCLGVVNEVVFSGSADKSVRVWRRGSGYSYSYSCAAVLDGHTNPVKCLTASFECSHNNGHSFVVYSGSLDCEVKVWKIWVPFTNLMSEDGHSWDAAKVKASFPEEWSTVILSIDAIDPSKEDEWI